MRDAAAPDLAIVGAARSGTSFLSATLGNHPKVDAGSVKEPNFYSSRWSEGRDWYDALFRPREEGLLRVDGSVSYTYPQHPHALERLVEAAPDVQVVYTVREPVARLVSHYQLFRYYYGLEDWGDLSQAIEKSAMFLGAGDYAHWLGRLSDLFPADNVIVVPFPVATRETASTTRLLLSRLGLDDNTDADLQATTFRNEVRDFRVPGLRSAHQAIQKSRFYPGLRATVGPERLRRLRQRVTKPADLPPAEVELERLTQQQRELIDAQAAQANDAVRTWLRDQDERLDLAWSAVWASHTAKHS